MGQGGTGGRSAVIYILKNNAHDMTFDLCLTSSSVPVSVNEDDLVLRIK